MVRKLCLCALMLAALLVVASGAQAQTGTLSRQPQGELFQRADGSFGYIVSPDDRLGQWQVASGAPQLWLELVQANPQLADPDLVRPGQELNVPPTLVRFFNIMKHEGNAPVSSRPVTQGDFPPAEPPAPAEAFRSNEFPWWGHVLFAIIVLLLIWLAVNSRRANRRAEEAVRRAEDAISESRRQDEQRRLADPYFGPPVREGGIPTVEAAEVFFAQAYRDEREAMTVARNNTLPPVVAIERIVPVDVRGPMSVRYRHQPEFRDLPKWTPAWQCFLSDGTFLIALMACANDVRSGGGYNPLPETQIRPRQDIPVRESNRQIWPLVPEGTTPEPTVPANLVECASVKVTSPSRYVLHPETGRETVVELGVLANWVRLGIEGDTVYAIIGGERRVIGRIVEAVETEAKSADPAEPTTVPAGDGAAVPSK